MKMKSPAPGGRRDCMLLLGPEITGKIQCGDKPVKQMIPSRCHQDHFVASFNIEQWYRKIPGIGTLQNRNTPEGAL